MSNKSLHKSGHSFSGIFVFLLIGIFAIASITLVLTGIKAYRNVTQNGNNNTQKLLAISYLSNKIRAYDLTGSVKLETRNGTPMLCLVEEFDGDQYETRIFYYQGSICEQFMLAQDEFDPDLGERLTEVKSMEFEQTAPNLLQMTVTLPDDSVHTLHMAMRSNQAG